MWINTYLPNDPQTTVLDSTELEEVLSEVSNLLNSCTFDDFIWIDDMNWDRNRNSGFAQILEKFICDHNIMDVWDKFPVKYTHIHTDFKSTSTIDRILTNERLLNVIQDPSALHIGENTSRHSHIYLKFDVGILPLNKVS